jgi:hypothetical protein
MQRIGRGKNPAIVPADFLKTSIPKGSFYYSHVSCVEADICFQKIGCNGFDCENTGG